MKKINMIKEKPFEPVTCASNNVNILLDNIHSTTAKTDLNPYKICLI